MSPLAYLFAAIMTFRRGRISTHEMSDAGYAALAISISLAFYYNAFRLFAFRTGLVDEVGTGQFTTLDSPVVMAVVLTLVFVGLTLFYGREQTSSNLFKKFDQLSITRRMIVNSCAVLFLGAPPIWLILELSLG